jgi:hypothetical protein
MREWEPENWNADAYFAAKAEFEQKLEAIKPDYATCTYEEECAFINAVDDMMEALRG